MRLAEASPTHQIHLRNATVTVDGPFCITWKNGTAYPIVEMDETYENCGTATQKTLIDQLLQRPNIAIPSEELAKVLYGDIEFDYYVNSALNKTASRARANFGLDNYMSHNNRSSLYLEFDSVPINLDLLPNPMSLHDLMLGENNQIVKGDGLPPNNKVQTLTTNQTELLRHLMSYAEVTDYVPADLLVETMYHRRKVDNAPLAFEALLRKLREHLPEGVCIESNNRKGLKLAFS